MKYKCKCMKYKCKCRFCGKTIHVTRKDNDLKQICSKPVMGAVFATCPGCKQEQPVMIIDIVQKKNAERYGNVVNQIKAVEAGKLQRPGMYWYLIKEERTLKKKIAQRNEILLKKVDVMRKEGKLIYGKCEE